MSKGRQKFIAPKNLTPKLSLVAAPLGNPQDMSLRAIETLRHADVLFCEDTRKCLQLCASLGVEVSGKKLQSLPGQTELDFDFSKFLDFQNWVFLSDAGTPVVNDPGAGLIAWARARELNIEALPGPSAPILLWQWSGGFGLPFHFAGFVPKTSQAKELEKFFTPALSSDGSFCFFDTKHQILATLDFLAEHASLADREIFVGREMTKTHEELLHAKAAELREIFRERLEADEGVGELTLLMRAEVSAAESTLDAEELLRIRSAPPKEAAKIISRLSGQSVKACYDLLIGK